jgi:pimeloyl-ACP methyl ester carboxylesterase
LRGFINDVVGGGPVVIVGASLGGGIALTLAAENPELVDKVVLIDAQVMTDDSSMMFYR